MSIDTGASLTIQAAGPSANNGSYHRIFSLGFVATLNYIKNGTFTFFAPFRDENPSTVGKSGDPTFFGIDFQVG